MKQVKKIFVLMLAALFALIMSAPALAAEINITNSVQDQVYNAYKIFDVTKSGTNFAYTIAANSQWLEDIQSWAEADATRGLSLALTTNGNYSVTFNNTRFDDTMAKVFAEYLSTKKEGKSADKTVTGVEGKTVTLTDLDAGYYFITSSLGSLCVLYTTTDTADIQEKNEKPDITKTADKTTANVGDYVTFTLRMQAGGNASTSYIIHDELTEGLVLDTTSFSVTTEEEGVSTDVSSDNYDIKINTSEEDGMKDNSCDFEIEFHQTYTSTLAQGKAVIITYRALLNDSIITTGIESNKTRLQYSSTYSEWKEVEIKNYGFGLAKVDDDNVILSDAKFELYTDEECTNKINLIKVTDAENGDYYRPALPSETSYDIIEAGVVKIDGLANGTYWLKETQAPAGYNPLTKPQSIILENADNFVTINDTIYVSGGLKVVNQSGSSIPTTGGIGTTIFYVLGGILLVGAGILLVTKKRMNSAK